MEQTYVTDKALNISLQRLTVKQTHIQLDDNIWSFWLSHLI